MPETTDEQAVCEAYEKRKAAAQHDRHTTLTDVSLQRKGQFKKQPAPLILNHGARWGEL